MENPNKKVLELIASAERSRTSELDISSLDISYIPEEIGSLVELRVLIAWQNNLTKLPKEIGKLKHLEILYLSGNKITELPPEIGELSNLKELYLVGNRLEKLPIEISYLKRLETLILINNRIKRLPIEIINLRSLRKIDLEKNPLSQPPIEIAMQGIHAIKNYFSSLIDTKELYNLKEAKILFIGEGGVGKTCLMNKLLNPKFSINTDEISTEGIDIKKWIIKSKDNSNEVKLNLWDFGGQEIYHATHQFFLTKRSLYLLIWTARKDDDIVNFDYWLNAISLLSDDAPLILIQNKIDERLKLIDEETIRKKFPNVLGFYKVSVKENKGITELSNAIRDEIYKLPHIGDTLPKAWVDIKLELEKLPDNYIDYSSYLNICKRYLLDNSKADFLSRYFHDLGIFLHFMDNAILKSIIFLKPDWATNAVYRIIDTKEVQLNHGLFNFSMLNQIWKDYPKDKYFLLIELMKRFELCFQISNTQNYIIPNLLSPSQGDIKWDDKYNIRFEYHYEFMPAGIIPRFIVRVHDLIKNDDFWKHGVIIRREEGEAIVRADQFSRKIIIRLRGQNRKEFLSIIRREIDYIHKTLNYPSVKEMLPCVCNECKKLDDPFFHSYEKLTIAKRKSRRTVECPHSLEQVSVEQLLGGIETVSTKDDPHGHYIQVMGNYYEQKNENKMKIETQNIYGGNNQFADKIINGSKNIDSKDKELLELFLNNSTEEERDNLVNALEIVKSPDVKEEDKYHEKSLLRKFLEEGVGEAGKVIANGIMTNSYWISLLGSF